MTKLEVTLSTHQHAHSNLEAPQHISPITQQSLERRQLIYCDDYWPAYRDGPVMNDSHICTKMCECKLILCMKLQLWQAANVAMQAKRAGNMAPMKGHPARSPLPGEREFRW